MKCQKVRNLFSGYLERTLPGDVRSVVEQHFADCEQCRDLFHVFSSAVSLMERAPELEPPAGLRSAVMAHIDEIRQARPRRVKWWQIDWEKVFTIRVSARSAVIGLALCFAAVLAAQLSPYHSVTAGFFPRSKTTEIMWGQNTGGVRIAGPWSPTMESETLSSSGLNVLIVPDGSVSVSSYSVVLSISGKELTDCSVYLLGADGNERDTVFSGKFSDERQKSVVKIQADPGEAPTLAQIRWEIGGRRHTQLLVLPAHFNQPKTMGADVWKGKMMVRDVLRLISERFGVVFQASGNLDQNVALSMVEPQTTNEALYNSLLRANFKWDVTGSKVYRVEPRN